MLGRSRKSTYKALILAAVALVGGTPAVASPAIIESTSGRVSLKRESWSGFRPVAVGTVLNQGDQIFPAKGVRVMVVCPDLSKRRASAGVPSGMKTICPVWEAVIAKAPAAPGTLGGTNPLIPYLITPRHSLLLGHTPTFRWNDVPGASQYTVRVMNPTGIVWEKQVKEAQVTYSGDRPLEPGVPYSLVVQTNTGKSSQEDSTSGLEFRVLRKPEAEIVEAEVAKIAQQRFSDWVSALLVANLYSSYVLPERAIAAYGLSPQTFKTYNLTAEAIATLEALIDRGRRSPIVYRTLGDIYWQTGLANLAADHYLKAIELAKSPEDLEERTMAQFGLAEVYAATDNITQARNWYSQARNGYIALGDTQRADFLKQQIESLEQ